MKKLILILTVPFFINGCSLIYSYSEDLPQRLSQWENENKFSLALNTISHIKPGHKDYTLIQKKKKSLIANMAKYEQAIIEKSIQLVNEGEWLNALQSLNEAEENILDTTNIVQQREKLLKEREFVIAAYEKEVLNIEVSNLVNKSDLYKKINKTVTKYERNELKIEEYDDLRAEVSQKLANKSEKQLRKGEYSKALSSIKLALSLNPDEKLTSRLNNIKHEVAVANRNKKPQYISEAKDLLTKLSQGYSQEILKETQEKIIWLNELKENDQEYKSVIKELKQHLRRGIKQRFEAARKLYSKGKTQEALIIWLDLKKLDPDNPKLLSHIERAEKVLQKLEKLSNKPANKK